MPADAVITGQSVNIVEDEQCMNSTSLFGVNALVVQMVVSRQGS